MIVQIIRMNEPHSGGKAPVCTPSCLVPCSAGICPWGACHGICGFPVHDMLADARWTFSDFISSRQQLTRHVNCRARPLQLKQA